MPESFDINRSSVSEREEDREKGEGRRLLHALEATGEFVFHGSPNASIAEFEPRQPQHWERGVAQPDGDPCIATTRYADFAIFRAITKDLKGSSQFGTRKDGSLFFATDSAMRDALNDAIGYVYVFSKDGFAPYSRDGKMSNENESGFEWRAHECKKPARCIRVTSDDLPEQIDIIGE
jgi:hypothetical protein